LDLSAVLTLIDERNKLNALQEQKSTLAAEIQTLLPAYELLLAKVCLRYNCKDTCMVVLISSGLLVVVTYAEERARPVENKGPKTT
jgi:hypothetical protein